MHAPHVNQNCREAALFDPEFGQWHFVSLDDLIER
jgi:hypothetical protein